MLLKVIQSNVISEGPWSQVSEVIHACHKAVHEHGAPRVATDIRIGTRLDQVQPPGTSNEYKVKSVERILEKWKTEGEGN